APAPSAGQPVAVQHRFEPVDPDHGLSWVAEARIVPPGRGSRIGRLEKTRVLGIGDGGAGDGEAVEPDAVSRPLAWMPFLPSHPEPPRGDFHQLHAVEYNRAHYELRRAHVTAGDGIRLRGTGARQGPRAAGQGGQ